MRISRPCYDKPHRCPGWAGGGWKSASDKHPCQNGSIRTKTRDYHSPTNSEHATCTCGADIVNIKGFDFLWRDTEGGTWCPQTTPGHLSGHRARFEYKYPASDPWRFGRCVGSLRSYSDDPSPAHGCGVVTIPWALRYLDPRWYTIYTYRIQNWLYFKKQDRTRRKQG